MRVVDKRIWLSAACLLAVVAAVIARDWYVAFPPDALERAKFVGRATCAECHAAQHQLWIGSDHDRAMELATDESVLGDFNDTTLRGWASRRGSFAVTGPSWSTRKGPTASSTITRSNTRSASIRCNST
jgi:hypothetical protein